MSLAVSGVRDDHPCQSLEDYVERVAWVQPAIGPRSGEGGKSGGGHSSIPAASLTAEIAEHALSPLGKGGMKGG